MTHDHTLGPLIAALAERDDLSPAELSVLSKVEWRYREYAAGSEIIAQRTKPTQSCLLTDGLGARAMWMQNGERQLTALHVKGDFVDLHGLLLRIMDHSVVALTPCRVAFVEHSVLRRISEEQPHLGRLLLTMVAIDASIQRNWILSLGRRRAEQRLAHLLCELFMRYRVVGDASENSFPFAVSQSTVADILGLSIVHTNRTVQHLRAANLIAWQSGAITIINWQGLCDLAEFDPLYLNLFRQKR